MSDDFDLSRVTDYSPRVGEYHKQLQRLHRKGFKTSSIEETVEAASQNLNSSAPQPFIIYGEPQSGKTEMMICLSARLVDDGFRLIIPLLNDSVDLLGQNLGRFRQSGLAPAPRNFTEILDEIHDIEGSPQILFCKKNGKDLTKLIDRIDGLGRVVIIDDEADYASPNSQVNKNEKSKINELIEKLKGIDGLYVGVTATPARLDLNNTFGNTAASWVEFKVHENYTGQEVFFPIGDDLSYSLKLLPDEGDNPKFAKDAFFRYLAACAVLNKDRDPENNYSMLVHTSGRVDDHQKDMRLIQKLIQGLDRESSKFAEYAKELWGAIKDRYPDEDAYRLVDFITSNISRNQLIVLNSKRDVSVSGEDASNPKALFTIIFGGNIVSRGVTLNNLISMYFTRNVKHKIQQDTYIQRARMFGTRGEYLGHFELTIPVSLYADWHRCFVYHKLTLDGARQGNAPVWSVDKRVSAVAPSSIDRASVFQTKSGVTNFELFNFTEEKTEKLRELLGNKNIVDITTLIKIAEMLSVEAIPNHLIQFIKTFEGVGAEVGWYDSTKIGERGLKERAEDGDDFSKVYRKKGFWESKDERLNPKANHHFKIFYNAEGKARVFHKYVCSDIKSLRFLQNKKHS